MQENFIPTGLNFSKPQCHIDFMQTDDIDEKVQELYDKAVKVILDRIRELGITQEDAALRCGVEQGSMSRYLGGSRGKNLPFKTILALAVGLEIDLSRLFDFYASPQEKIKALLSEISKMTVNE